jgi:hypothetical protein
MIGRRCLNWNPHIARCERGCQGEGATELPDTHPAVERIQIELMRQAPPWRKLALVGELNRTAEELALVGLRRRLANLLLGSELAMRAHGPLVPGEGR